VATYSERSYPPSCMYMNALYDVFTEADIDPDRRLTNTALADSLNAREIKVRRPSIFYLYQVLYVLNGH
jgi:hypothetical protein